ncbi:GntR family transcriptional regulator [Arthrobacter sp. MYb211]|uniref:GntR family transcriptional regulator n=1 Tax=unclassified Arthrobacter TaxID=235627 RepID=UPI000CFD782F|nr:MULTISPECIES: GntR family transcriptional regulator [unclassified Arthrobacter]PRA12172.1 GntR family transcriptional regulator [Arthrobacter sp. MYb221]PRC08635.1 GntR family transcriptional regulator [Arthrobacter sp. MYb211]
MAREASIEVGQLAARATLKETTEAIIRRALLDGTMQPGEIYSANALAGRLGISNSPAREAMITLADKGLLEPIKNRGYRVVDMSDRDRQEVYDLRMLIEVEAVRRVALRGISDETCGQLRKLVDSTVRVAESGDVVEYLEVDQEFHVELVKILGNRRWVGIIENLRDQSRINGAYHLQERGLLTESAQEHRDIIDAVTQGDSRRVVELMTRHLEYARP